MTHITRCPWCLLYQLTLSAEACDVVGASTWGPGVRWGRLAVMPRPLVSSVALFAALALIVAACGSTDAEGDAAPVPESSDRAAEPSAEEEPTPTPAPAEAPAATPTPTPAPAIAGCEAARGVTTYQLDAGGAVHDVQVFVPSAAAGTDMLPVVLNWHGLGSNGPQQALFSDYEALAEQEGFVVVHPTERLDDAGR